MGPIKRGGKRSPVAEINVTPLVDVMLVLLIIFMVTAPMMTQGVDVDLPETTPVPLRQQEQPIVVTINAKGEIFINNIKGDRALLRQQLGNLAQTGKDKPIFLKADRRVPYGLVVAVMADIKEVGFDKLGMITRPEDEGKS
ncbi:MAG: protein TolR [Desulfobacteraceae bacterium]|nr:protein TolR [Desulfobacteraceae bacterium]